MENTSTFYIGDVIFVCASTLKLVFLPSDVVLPIKKVLKSIIAFIRKHDK